VSPLGSVVGIERSADAVALAGKLVFERGLENVEGLEGGRSIHSTDLSFETIRNEIERRTVFHEKVPTSLEMPFSPEQGPH
jgi:hypothetical protein